MKNWFPSSFLSSLRHAFGASPAEAVRSLVLVMVLYFIILGCVVALMSYLKHVILMDHGCDWTGFGTCPTKDVRIEKTLWDWLDLLIVPIVLAVVSYVYNRTEKANDRRAADRRAFTERDIARDVRQDGILREYFDRMSQLLLDEERPLRKSQEADEVRSVARTRTLSTLRELDGDRRGRVLQFLHESRLIQREMPIVDLNGADFMHAELVGANFRGANLARAYFYKANLRTAYLENVYLERGYLEGANLKEAFLYKAFLYQADLKGVNLEGAQLKEANLKEADLKGANLEGARYDDMTQWPDGFKPEDHGAVNVGGGW